MVREESPEADEDSTPNHPPVVDPAAKKILVVEGDDQKHLLAPIDSSDHPLHNLATMMDQYRDRAFTRDRQQVFFIFF
jgi:hypothetical protein